MIKFNVRQYRSELIKVTFTFQINSIFFSQYQQNINFVPFFILPCCLISAEWSCEWVCIWFLLDSSKQMSEKNRSTIELIKCELFKDMYVIEYLHEHSSNEEVVRALISKMRGMALPQQLRILPCVIYVFQNHPDKNMERFLCDLCQDNFARYLIIKWAFNAYTLHRSLSAQREDEYESIRNHIDTHAINGKEPDFTKIPQEELSNFIVQWSQEKQQRSEFVVQINEFYSSLTRICIKLKNFTNEKPNQSDVSLGSCSRAIFRGCSSRCPRPQTSYLQGEKQIINITYDCCYTFSTKERVPYKLVFETVDHEQLLKHDLIAKFDILTTVPKHFLDELSVQSQGDLNKQMQMESMTPKEIQLNSKINTFFAQHRMVETLYEKSQMSTKSEIMKPLSLKLQHSYFEQDWEEKMLLIKEKSPYKELQSYRVRSYLVKAGDDLRQEFFSMQLIRMVGDIYKEMNLPLWIKPYDIIMFSRDEGFIEFLPNTMTISSLKKFGNLSQIYRQIYGDGYQLAITNFTKSLAGYSLICYLFQIKDRHNGNLLIDSEGHIIHIDFSFILSKCPGNIQFERAPFKLTQEYIELMGGIESDLFLHFKELLFIGITCIKKYGNEIVKYVEVIREKNDLPCFQHYDRKEFEKRMMLKATDEEIRKHVDNLIYYAAGAYWTSNYDRFQYYTNGIRQ